MYLLSMLLSTAQEESGSTIPGPVQDVIPAIIGAITTLITLYITKKFSKAEKKSEEKQHNYRVELDQLVKQREFVIKENEELWHALKLELDLCRVEREKLDAEVDSLKSRLTRVEQELQAWELGLKTPVGFKLTRIERDDF